MLDLIKTLHQELIDRLSEIKDNIARDIDFIEVKNKISVAIGMRRSGKTYLMLQKIQKLISEGIPISRILYIDFEDDRLLPLDEKKLANILDDFYKLFPENHQKLCYLFLDEIQVIENWALVIRRFYNTKKVRLYLSGSSAKLLSKEIATELRGRSISTEVFPFNFHEYLQVKKIPVSTPPYTQMVKDILGEQLTHYLQEGGFPGVVGESAINQRLILQEYLEVVLLRDIIERYEVTNISVIKYMIIYLLKNYATRFTVNKFFNDLKSQGFNVGRSSVYDYLSYIEDAYLIFTVPLYSESIRKIQSNPKKIYAIDNGMVNANILSSMKNNGRTLENAVFLDLRRKGNKIYYYITAEGYEIDFLACDLEGNLHLYQVAYEMEDEKTKTREYRALLAAEKELGIKGTLITKENYPSWVLGNRST
jgi:predicted AAA+ superfamily ATPase